MFLTQIFAVFGLAWVLLISLRILRFTWIYTRTSSLKRYQNSAGDQKSWALVTGSTDGIGQELALQLASQGFNIFLHGRNRTKLLATKKRLLLASPNTEVALLIADATAVGQDLIKGVGTMVEQIGNSHLTVLVNNVGGGGPPNMAPLYKTLDQYTASDVDGTMSLNVRFTVLLTASVLPILLRSGKPALIMNIGSAADSGLPWLNIYSGCKAFIAAWSVALAREMKAEKRPVEVLCVVPASVTGVSFNKEKGTLMQPDSETWAESALSRVGCGEMVVPGWWMHGFMLGILGSLPESIRGIILENSMVEQKKRDWRKLD